MLEMIPHPRLLLKQSMQHKKAINRLVRRFQRAFHIHAEVLVLVRAHQHQAVEIIAGQEQRLPRQALVAAREFADGCFGEGAEGLRERSVDALEAVDDAGAVRGGEGDG